MEGGRRFEGRGAESRREGFSRRTPEFRAGLASWVERYMPPGRLAEVAASPFGENRSRESLLLEALTGVLVEQASEWDAQARAQLRQFVNALRIAAYPNMTAREQRQIREIRERIPGAWPTQIEDPEEVRIDIQRTWQRFDFSSPEIVSGSDLEGTYQQLGLPVRLVDATEHVVADVESQRITDVEDPIVTDFLDAASRSEDKIGYALANIRLLPLRQQVALLLTFSNVEHQEFEERYERGAMSLVVDFQDDPSVFATPEEYIRARSRLQHTRPRYLIEAELRRRDRLTSGEDAYTYPPEWDLSLEEDIRFTSNDGLPRMRNGEPISYEEAVDRARFEYTRKFYRNRYFPGVSGREGTPISANLLEQAFLGYREQLIASGRPGTDISLQDLRQVIDYYLDYEADNEESCRTHNQVRELIDFMIRNREESEIPSEVVPAVQVVLTREGTNGTEVFLGHRIAGGFLNQWSFPGGRMDDGEDHQQTARRELREETGVDVPEDSFIFLRDTQSSTVREKGGRRIRYDYHMRVFTVDAQGLDPQNASPDEHSEMRWMSLTDALAMHEQAVSAAREDAEVSLSPDMIPGALAPRTLETINFLLETR